MYSIFCHPPLNHHHHHLYPLGLSRALRQARLPSAYKCISCPWTSCTTWNRGDADDESEISRMVFSFLCIWWWFCTMTGLLAVSNWIFTAPSIGIKVHKGIFLVYVAIYWESNLHIFYQPQISQHSNLIFMPLEYFRHLDMCWSGFKDREHILSTCQLLIYAINCRLARWWWWSWWIIAIVIMMIILWLWLRMKKLWSYGHDYNHLSADNLCHQMQLVVRIMI